MDIKAALTAKDRKVILHSSEYGEDLVKGNYEKALKEDAAYLRAAEQSMIEAQYTLLKADHDKLKMMRDNLVEQD